MEYVVIFERGKKSYGAYVPDLPGCVAVGETREEAAHLIREAIALHVAGLRRGGLGAPSVRACGLTASKAAGVG